MEELKQEKKNIASRNLSILHEISTDYLLKNLVLKRNSDSPFETEHFGRGNVQCDSSCSNKKIVRPDRA